MSDPSQEAGALPRLPAPFQPTQPVEQAVQTIETLLAECLSGMAIEPPPAGRGRPRVLPSLALWAGLLVCVVRGFSSQLALWRLLRQGGCWLFPPLAHHRPGGLSPTGAGWDGPAGSGVCRRQRPAGRPA